MSMDQPASGHDARDTDMSDAAGDDPELALGESMFSCITLFSFSPVMFHRDGELR